jgi:hypothetical protein
MSQTSFSFTRFHRELAFWRVFGLNALEKLLRNLAMKKGP